MKKGNILKLRKHEWQVDVFVSSSKIYGSVLSGARHVVEDVAQPEKAPQCHQPTSTLHLQAPTSYRIYSGIELNF